MRAEEFIVEYAPPANIKFKEPEEQLDIIVKGLMDEGRPMAYARDKAINWVMENNPEFSKDIAMAKVDEAIKRTTEGNKKNTNALVGSGRADPHGKKTNPDSNAHKKVRTPGTGPNARTKYNNGAEPGANPGFIGE